MTAARPSSRLLVVVLLLTLSATSAAAAWNPNGVTIKSTSTPIPEIVAVRDLAGGAIVAWREGTAGPGTTGVLRAQHVLATGAIDPAWPADGMMVCDTPVNAATFQILPDAAGGAYVAWQENRNWRMTRITAQGVVASGWSTRGRSLIGAYSMSFIADGEGGVFAAGSTLGSLSADYSVIQLLHVRSDGTNAPGYPATGRTVVGGDPVLTWDIWPSLALAPDGGVFLAWASWSQDEEAVPSAMRLVRLTSAGAPAASWPAGGVVLAGFPGQNLYWGGSGDSPPTLSLVAITPDRAGGVFALVGDLAPSEPGASFVTRLLRIGSDGTLDPAWPAGGRAVSASVLGYMDVGIAGSLRLLSDRHGGVQAGSPQFYTHATEYNFVDFNPATSWDPGASVGAEARQVDCVVNGDGGVFLTDCNPAGPYGPYQPGAYLRVQQSDAPAGWSDLFEYHPEPVMEWYGDVAVAESPDGGAIFFWSQRNQIYGLFAKKFDGSGEVTAISPPIRVRALDIESLRFVAGEGVQASLAIPDGESATLDLFDVSGRRVASSALTSSDGGRPLTIGGTRGLSSGLYFARLASANAATTGKVVVSR